MAAAVLVEVADAVTAALNAAVLSQPFTAERRYVPFYSDQAAEGADELATLRVAVLARDLRMATLSRAEDRFEYGVDVAVHKRVGPTPSECDPLMLLVQEILDLFRNKPLAGYTLAKATAATNAPIYDPTHLEELRAFVGVVGLTFVMARAR